MIKLRSLLIFSLFWVYLSNLAQAIENNEILTADQAFHLQAFGSKTGQARFSWTIADGYYLYQNKFKIVSLTPGIAVENLEFPKSIRKQDEFFGDVDIYRNQATINAVLNIDGTTPDKSSFKVTSQGCADIGFCLPPKHETVTIELDTKPLTALLADEQKIPDIPDYVSEQNRIAESLIKNSIWATFLGFLGFGLLLAFTPCVFPMIPILSGIIAGQKQKLTTARAFSLSFSYVLASALTYTIFGILAGLFGQNLQVWFQEPAVIIAFSAVFVLLALSMFGLLQLQMPAYIQAKASSFSSRQQNGSLTGAAAMGCLSTLIIGPCVTAPLAGILIFIGQTGNAVLGGFALFALGLGMGIPLLIIGTSAGKLMPKAGAWMNAIKNLFGIGLLAVAVWLLSRILPQWLTFTLWASLVALPLIILIWHKLWRGFVAFSLTYGIVLLLALYTHGPESVKTLMCNAAAACENEPALDFIKVHTNDELKQQLADAKTRGQWVMLDFYADWCTACLEMEHYTFADPSVKSALSKTVLLQIDVTRNTDQDQNFLQQFNLPGPPATLFFAPDQQELTSHRVVGFMKADQFLDHLNYVFQAKG